MQQTAVNEDAKKMHKTIDGILKKMYWDVSQVDFGKDNLENSPISSDFIFKIIYT